MALTTTWSPTQQVRALVLLHELGSLLATEARARTQHGNRQAVDALEAVGRRALPPEIIEIAGFSALRLAGSGTRLQQAVDKFTTGTQWAERSTMVAAAMLRQGARFTDAGHHLDQLARAISGVDVEQVSQLSGRLLSSLHTHRQQHAAEDPAIAPTAIAIWTRAIELLVGATSALGLTLIAPPLGSPAATVVATPRMQTNTGTSTPYQPSLEPGIESEVGGGGSRALRRRRN